MYFNSVNFTYSIIMTLFCTMFFSSVVIAESKTQNVKVVANISPPPFTLGKQEIRNLFMGGSSKFKLYPVTLTGDNDARMVFNTKVIGLTEARIQSYWVQMRFSGRLKEPVALASESEVLEHLKNNKGAIAYVSSDIEIPDTLHVLYESE